MAHEWIRTTLMTALLSTALVGASSCKEEQVLYEVKGDQVAQASQPASRPASAMELPPGHPPMDGTTGGGSELPPGHPAIDQGAGGDLHMRFAPPPEDRPALAADAKTEVKTLHGVTFSVPLDWNEVPEGELSTMRAAQWEIPAPDGADRGAELVAYYFGRNQGGTAIANVSRWLGQLELDENIQPEIFQHMVGKLDVTEVHGVGTLKASMMGGSGAAEEDSALYGVIIEKGPEGSVFLKMTGGRAAVEDAMPALVTLVTSLKTDGTGAQTEDSPPEAVQDWWEGRMKKPELKELEPPAAE